MAVVEMPYIDVDEKGKARIAGSRIKVMHLVMERKANDWTLEQVQGAFPHLSLAQVYTAFAYYFDHRELIDRQIQESIEYIDRLRQENAEFQAYVAERVRLAGSVP